MAISDSDTGNPASDPYSPPITVDPTSPQPGPGTPTTPSTPSPNYPSGPGNTVFNPGGSQTNFPGQINYPPGGKGPGTTQGANGCTVNPDLSLSCPAGSPSGSAPAPTAGWNTNNIDLTGIDPRLTAFFQAHNLQPTARGTGPTDIAYWNDLLGQPGSDWGYLQGRILGAPGLGDNPSTTAGAGSQFNDPSYQALNALAQQYSSSFQQAAQQQSAALQKLQDMLAANQQQSQQLAQTFAGQLGQRVNQLQNTPLYSDQQTAAIRQQASSQLQAARDQAIQNARQQTFARGFAPTSGVLNDQLQSINRDSSNAQSNIDAQLLASAGQANEQRLNEATQLQGLAAQALQGANITGLQEQAQAADAQYQQQQIQRQQMMDALSTAAIPVSLTNSGVSNALQTLQSGGNPGSTLSQMMTLLGLGNQQQGLQQTNQNNTASGIGQLLAMILQGFSG